MLRESVRSSNLRSVGYDADSATLEVEFSDRSVWQYKPVPASVYSGLMAAGSKGSFFHRTIRGRYAAHPARH